MIKKVYQVPNKLIKKLQLLLWSLLSPILNIKIINLILQISIELLEISIQDIYQFSVKYNLKLQFYERTQIIYHKLSKLLSLFRLKSLSLRNIKKQIQRNVKQDTSSYPLCFDIVLQRLLYLLKIDPSSSSKLFEMIKPHFSLDLNSQKYTLILEAN